MLEPEIVMQAAGGVLVDDEGAAMGLARLRLARLALRRPFRLAGAAEVPLGAVEVEASHSTRSRSLRRSSSFWQP